MEQRDKIRRLLISIAVAIICPFIVVLSRNMYQNGVLKENVASTIAMVSVFATFAAIIASISFFIYLFVKDKVQQPIEVAEPIIPVLWKQILGMAIMSILVIIVGGVRGGLWAALTGICTFCDAWSNGIYKRNNNNSIINISPMGWGIAMEGLLILTYPIYLIKRNKLKTKSGNGIFFALTVILGGLSFVLFGIQIILMISHR